MSKKRFNKVYIEITNRCNLACSFCHGTKRALKNMTRDEFLQVLQKVKPYTDFVYFHLMGEPLLHPDFGQFLKDAMAMGLNVCITTNGTLLMKRSAEILSAVEEAKPGKLHKISISLQAQEANGNALNMNEYLKTCFEFGKLIEGKTIISYRLWNEGGLNENNEAILQTLYNYFDGQSIVQNDSDGSAQFPGWKKHQSGFTIGNNVFLEFGETFEWPDPQAELIESEHYYCYGLKDQIGILSDGTVVPCCLDSDGNLALGNIFSEELEDILNNKKALGIIEGFKNRHAAMDMCKRCGYASRFAK